MCPPAAPPSKEPLTRQSSQRHTRALASRMFGDSDEGAVCDASEGAWVVVVVARVTVVVVMVVVVVAVVVLVVVMMMRALRGSLKASIAGSECHLSARRGGSRSSMRRQSDIRPSRPHFPPPAGGGTQGGVA